jgi:hypothetical protein
MRRLIVAIVAITLALSPAGVAGLPHGASSAHADLGWCPECEESASIPVNEGHIISTPLPALPPLQR